MVKVVFLGLLAATMCALVSTGSDEPHSPQESLLVEDPAVRSERSTNLSHVTGIARKIQMYIKNRHLQLLPDGTVNGTADDASPYTILQRTTVGIGQLKIQGVATCQYLCMDGCGLLYGSREFGDECVFNEMIEHHHYNTYSSTKYSNERRTLYLALNRRGQPRKVMLRANQPLGKLSSYTRVLTRTVSAERAEDLHPMRHHSHMCASSTPGARVPTATPTDPPPTDGPRCRKRRKRKKKKRKCAEGEPESEACHKRQTVVVPVTRKTVARFNSTSSSNSTKKCDVEDSDECQRVDVPDKKRHKTKFGDKLALSGAKKRKKQLKGVRNKKSRAMVTSTETVVTTEEMPSDEDYTIDATTVWEWEDSTANPDEFSTPRPD